MLRRLRSKTALVVTVLVGLTVPVVQAMPSRAASPPQFNDASGIHVVAVTQIDPRQYNVKVTTPAFDDAAHPGAHPVDIRILLPADYDSAAATRYPVLYLYHGTSGRASDWVQMGDAEATTAPLELITVMPDAGFNGNGGGWFTNWVDQTTALGPSQWESFHIGQLIPWVDANLHTIADRTGRAVAGLSQGGFGSTTYPARHPDTFVSAASFSGAPDIDYNPLTAAGATAIIQATAVGLDGVQPDAMFGSRLTDEINWQGHDPADLVTNLRPVDVWLYTATGAPGPYDPTPPNPAAQGIELATHGSTVSFYQRALQQKVPVHFVDYVYGTHSWPYWARDLRQYVVPMMQTFANPPATPAVISYQSIDKSWSQFGWDVSLARPATQQFSSLTDAGPNGFAVQGSGTATITTPAFYTPGAVKTATISGLTASSSAIATADGAGRLHLTVPLGLDQLPGPIGSAAVMGLPGVPPSGTTATVTIR